MINKNNVERLFIAIEFPEYVIHELISFQKQLEKLQLFEGKYISTNQLHLTLKFIGEVNENKKLMIQEALRSIKYSSFEGCLGELGVLPSEKYIRIIWVDVIAQQLLGLVEQIERALQPIVQLEERPFLSHITIARVKRVPDKEKLVEALANIKISEVCFKVTEFVLKKSDLTEHGSVYYDVEHYSLT